MIILTINCGIEPLITRTFMDNFIHIFINGAMRSDIIHPVRVSGG